MRTKDSALANTFLVEFVKNLTSRFPNEIDFILLFGSAARGEFKRGISDIDIIIQLKNKRRASQVEKYAEQLFWKLDEKYDTKLREVCSTKRDDIFSSFEKELKLYKPFEILGPHDIDWSKGEIRGKELVTFATIAPIHQFAKKVKKEGKILYGRNILEEILIKESVLDKTKALIIPYLLSILAFPLSIISPDKGLKYSIKAVLYAIDEQIDLLENITPTKTFLKIRILRAQLGQYYSIRLAKEAFYAKRNFDKIRNEWSYLDKVAFCFQAPIYIAYNNILGLLYLVKEKGGNL